MWKYLFAILTTAVVITASVFLYRHRDQLFRPDVHKVGGTLIAFAIAEGEPDDAYCTQLRRRFDPRGKLGVLVQKGQSGEIEVLVPNSKTHDDLVEQVKRIAARPGQVTFRAIATSEEDNTVMVRLAAEYASGKSKKGPITSPPSLPLTALGSRDFAMTHPGMPPRRYRWDRLSDAALLTCNLDPTSLAGPNAAEKPMVDQALAAGTVWSPKTLPGCNVLVTRLPGVSAPAFLLLTREEEDARAFTNDNIREADVVKDRAISTQIWLRLDRLGQQRMATLTESRGAGMSRVSRGGSRGVIDCLALVVDDEIVAFPQVFSVVHQDIEIRAGSTDEEAEDFAALMRGNVKGVQLNPLPTRVVPIEPRR